ncbi:MFS transporter [Fictibacillus phosphorivorans]|uniref:MFS transporter n=1 Tax=Fictibacillus phosphorivorans TaxID=1221500 RepID=UPI002040E729|nr:MFS transporter [Fictibacillus phosphorivorans]MCM3719908.1 MFS transporter [Fictibacillus phosphorivorans]MCM3777638.1 MFS transporter [Fictibacillus phosphorivorans]
MKHRTLLVYLVAFAAFLGPFSQTIYVPLIPEVTKELHTTSFLVNFSISIYTIFLALMQMVYGPLTDSIGRRKVMLAGIVIYLVATVGCFLSGSIESLLVFRSLQAVGIAAGSVVAVTVIGDLFEGKDRIQPMGTFQMMVSLGPVLGPVAGGFISGSFDFHVIFIALLCVGTIVLAGNFVYLKETKPPSSKKQNFKFTDFINILKNRIGFSVIGIGFIQYYALYNFLVFLPGIMSERYGLSVEQKGLVFLPLSLGIVVGSFVGGKLRRFEERKVVVGTAFLNVLSLLFFILVSDVSLRMLIVSISLFGLFLGMSLPVQTALLTQEFQKNRATAIGAYNFFRYMGMSIGPLLGSFLFHIGSYNLAYGFVDAILFMFALIMSNQLLMKRRSFP